MRPGDDLWPTENDWKRLNREVQGALVALPPLWARCLGGDVDNICAHLFRHARNPYYLSDEAALTQSFGWVDAWSSSPSTCAVMARSTHDVAAAVNFAREKNLRLVVKGGGHSYQGTSNAADSLLIWTRKMSGVTLHDAFIAMGCGNAPVRAVSVEAGALWAHVYDAVTTRGGGYVQGGGCMTVGVAGLVQSGGFGSFSKAYGLAAGSLLEVEVVTADGAIRIANAAMNPDLFWALKGGGGGSFGVVTRLTLRVHELPETFGAVNFTVRAKSAESFRKLISLTMNFYRRCLMNAHWGEQIRFRSNNVMTVAMVFQGLDRRQAQEAWQPFFDAVYACSEDLTLDFSPFSIVSTSARTFWSPSLVKKLFGFMKLDDRPGAAPENVFWPGDEAQAGQIIHGYQSAWLPVRLLQEESTAALCDALFRGSRHWGIALHFNKGLAGASEKTRMAAADTAINPVALDAFALAISAASGPPAHADVPGHEPNVAVARKQALATACAMGELKKLVPDGGSYVAESDFFEKNWQRAYWGANYERLLAVKMKYDPDGLFFVHHGVGSERWDAEGFRRLA